MKWRLEILIKKLMGKKSILNQLETETIVSPSLMPRSFQRKLNGLHLSNIELTNTTDKMV